MSRDIVPASSSRALSPATGDASPRNWPAYSAARPAAQQWEPLRGGGARRALCWLLLAALTLLVAGGIVWAIWERQPLPRVGEVHALGAGRLQIRDGSAGPWTQAAVGRPVRQGAELRAKESVGAVVLLPDGVQLRIDSAGSWQVISLQVSRDGHVSEVILRQALGSITAASAPAGRLDQHMLYVQVPGNTIELHGTATLSTEADGRSLLTVLAGEALVHQGGDPVPVGAGRTAILRPGSPPVGAATAQ
jgi:hypothetical protein